jgi:hypothetical protein
VSLIPPPPANVLPTAPARVGGRVALWGRLGDDAAVDAIVSEVVVGEIGLSEF